MPKDLKLFFTSEAEALRFMQIKEYVDFLRTIHNDNPADMLMYISRLVAYFLTIYPDPDMSNDELMTHFVQNVKLDLQRLETAEKEGEMIHRKVTGSTLQ